MDKSYSGKVMNSLGRATVDGQSRVQVGNTYSNEVHYHAVPSHNRCLTDLRVTDPRSDKLRIEQTSGGLSWDSYNWIVRDEDFNRWRNNTDCRLLWINGDAGKGKTMLLCGIINELLRPPPAIPGAKAARVLGEDDDSRSPQSKEPDSSLPNHSRVLFFFCQASSDLNNATAVLRGLLFLLACEQPSLTHFLEERYDHAGKQLFEDTNSFYTLSQTLTDMLDGQEYVIIIDALDECEVALPQLLSYIGQNTSAQSGIKWLVSSRKSHEIEQHLYRSTPHTSLSLELNASHITRAINALIDQRVKGLVSLRGDVGMQEQVQHALKSKASGTFLWVALVLKELEKAQPWSMLNAIREMPSGLQAYYMRMLIKIQELDAAHGAYCQPIISTMTVSYRPLQLLELAVLSGLPTQYFQSSQNVQTAVDLCGSFLTVRADQVYLIHQSVRNFLLAEAKPEVFPHGIAHVHHAIFSRSLRVMSETLVRDRYRLDKVWVDIDVAEDCRPTPDPLDSAKYSCVHWVNHLAGAVLSKTPVAAKDLLEDGAIHRFIEIHYLHWLEALSLLRSMSAGVAALQTLKMLTVSKLRFRCGSFN